MRRTVFDQAGDNFAAAKVHKTIFVDTGGLSAQGVFKESRIMSAYSKNEKVSGIADYPSLNLW